MGFINTIVFDCEEPAKLAAFWTHLLDGYQVREPSDAQRAITEALGLTAESEATVMLDGPGPAICFQNVDGQRPDNNRVHFDIAVADRAGEVERLVAAGAEPVRVLPSYTVMCDPEGNQFCLLDQQPEAKAVAA